MSDETRCVHARIHGRVQGVFYRAWTEETARGLGLSGWVRNRRDGTVEALFCGPAGAVEQMLLKARSGPPLARVDRIIAEEVREPPHELPHEPPGAPLDELLSGPPGEPRFQVLPTV